MQVGFVLGGSQCYPMTHVHKQTFPLPSQRQTEQNCSYTEPTGSNFIELLQHKKEHKKELTCSTIKWCLQEKSYLLNYYMYMYVTYVQFVTCIPFIFAKAEICKSNPVCFKSQAAPTCMTWALGKLCNYLHSGMKMGVHSMMEGSLTHWGWCALCS